MVNFAVGPGKVQIKQIAFFAKKRIKGDMGVYEISQIHKDDEHMYEVKDMVFIDDDSIHIAECGDAFEIMVVHVENILGKLDGSIKFKDVGKENHG